MVLKLDSSLTLPCGLVLPNRVAKTAMGEGLADLLNRATPGHASLYGRWARGGAGLLITGAVQMDRRYLDRPTDIVLDGPQSPDAMKQLRTMAAAGKSSGAAILMQLSHSGLQSAASWCTEPVGPSVSDLASKSRALSGAEIEDVVRRFVLAAGIAAECGFDGVQILAGQGRLIGSFLNQAENLRTDEWGGDFQQRAQLLLDIVRNIRVAYGPQFALSVKLDMGCGGLDAGDIVMLCDWLSRDGVDLIEISQGVYGRLVRPAPAGQPAVATPDVIRVAKIVRAARRSCVMLSGGLRSRMKVDELLKEGALDVAGFAQPFCADPDFSHEFLDSEAFEFADVSAKLAPDGGRLTAMLNKLESATGLHATAIEAWCALAMCDLAEGLDAPRRRSAQAALRDFAKRERAFVKGLAA